MSYENPAQWSMRLSRSMLSYKQNDNNTRFLFLKNDRFLIKEARSTIKRIALSNSTFSIVSSSKLL